MTPRKITLIIILIFLILSVAAAFLIPMIPKKKWTRPVRNDKGEVRVLSIKRGDRANFPDFFLVVIDKHEYVVARFTNGLTMVHHAGCSAIHLNKISI